MNIHAAADNGNLNRVRTLLNQGVSVNTRDGFGQTPLHMAAQSGHLNVVKELIRRGAHMNPRNRRGSTPLHIAWDPNVFHTLIKAGANPKYRTKNTNKNAFNTALTNNTRNAVKTSRATSKWINVARKRKAERMLLSPRLLGSVLPNNAIRSISKYLTVKKKNNNK